MIKIITILQMDKTEISLLSVLVVVFVLTPYLPNNIISITDHPVVRFILILLPFIGLYISNITGLLTALIIGAFFLERNNRKLVAMSGNGTWWRSADGQDIPGPLPKDLPVAAKSGKKIVIESPYMVGSAAEGCDAEMDSPIIEADIDRRPVFETLIGDSSSRGAIDNALGNIQRDVNDITFGGVQYNINDAYSSFSS